MRFHQAPFAVARRALVEERPNCLRVALRSQILEPAAPVASEENLGGTGHNLLERAERQRGFRLAVGVSRILAISRRADGILQLGSGDLEGEVHPFVL